MEVYDAVRHSSTTKLECELRCRLGPLSRCQTPAFSATLQVGRGKRGQKIPHMEYAPLGETRRMNKLGPWQELQCIPFGGTQRLSQQESSSSPAW